MRILFIAFALFSTGIWAADGYNPKAFETKCKNVNDIAKEAVAYSLVGAWEPYANHKCFAKEKFHFFHPELGEPEGEIIDPSKLIQFKKGRDQYSIEGVKKDGQEYLIAVKFTIDKKAIATNYRYTPDPAYMGRTGICGFVTNSEHKIVRSDCIDAAKRKKAIEASGIK
jgi:hypothetical protein